HCGGDLMVLFKFFNDGDADFFKDLDVEWIQWTPVRAKKRPDVADAIRSFVPALDNPAAGERNARFLKEEALDSWPSTVTHLLFKNNRFEGFFAFCSGTATITQRAHDVAPADPGDREVPVPRYQPVAHISWICRHDDSPGVGTALLAQALAVAVETIAIG